MSKKLTAKQATFIQEYLIDLNATQAAIRAGYSEKTAKVVGYENLTKPYIAEAVQAAMDKRAEKTEITQVTVLHNIEKLRIKAEDEKQFSVAAKCLEMQGKHVLLFKDSDAGNSITINIERGCSALLI